MTASASGPATGRRGGLEWCPHLAAERADAPFGRPVVVVALAAAPLGCPRRRDTRELQRGSRCARRHRFPATALLAMSYQPAALSFISEAGALLSQTADAIAVVRRNDAPIRHIRMGLQDAGFDVAGAGAVSDHPPHDDRAVVAGQGAQVLAGGRSRTRAVLSALAAASRRPSGGAGSGRQLSGRQGRSTSRRRLTTAAMACRSSSSELTTRSCRRRAPSTTHASTMSVVAARAASEPTERAWPSSSASTWHPASSRASRAWRPPPRQDWATTGAGVVGTSRSANRARCRAHMRRSPRSAAMSAPVS
jgi:hypothetical protein